MPPHKYTWDVSYHFSYIIQKEKDNSPQGYGNIDVEKSRKEAYLICKSLGFQICSTFSTLKSKLETVQVEKSQVEDELDKDSEDLQVTTSDINLKVLFIDVT